MNADNKGRNGTMTDSVVKFESPKEHYTADACIFWCFDDRFWKLRKRFIEALGFKSVDVVQAAGGAKALAGGDTPERQFLLGQLDASIRLHHTKCVILMVHIDCGAYGGSKQFKAIEDEYAHHTEELAKAHAFISGKYPELEVERYIADFEGLRRIR